MGRGLAARCVSEEQCLVKRLWYLRDLHVVTELEVGDERQRLGHGDVTPGLEHHHRDRLSGKGVTNDELSDDVEADLLVRDGLDHADGDDVDVSDDLQQR